MHQIVHRNAHDLQGRGDLWGDAGRRLENAVLVDRGEFGIGPGARAGKGNQIALGQIPDALAEAVDLPGTFLATDIRRRAAAQALAGDDVGIIDPNGVEPDQNFAGSRLGNGKFHQGQNLGSAESGYMDRFHFTGTVHSKK